MKRALFLLMAMLAAVPAARADEPAEALAALRAPLDRVMAVLRDPALDAESRHREVVSLAEPLFDFPLMAKLALGRDHWLSLTPDQQRRYERLFVERLKSSYLQKLDLYTDQRIRYQAPAAAGPGKVHVPTVVADKDNEIGMRYKMYRSPQGWRIYDVEIQGVSIITTFRSQFDHILRDGSVEALMRELETPPGS